MMPTFQLYNNTMMQIAIKTTSSPTTTAEAEATIAATSTDTREGSVSSIQDDVERKRALITGINGQVGSYLAELLIAKGYHVHGMIRRESSLNNIRLAHLYEDKINHTGSRLQLHYGDLTDSSSLFNLIATIRPDEIYNLAAQSHVKISFEMAEVTGNANALGTLRVLEAIRQYESLCNNCDNYYDKPLAIETTAATATAATATNYTNRCPRRNNLFRPPPRPRRCRVKFYQASTSELFGGTVNQIPQNESTPFYPRSPYACSKLYAHSLAINYRESYNLFAVCGILFNHESPRRGENFVTRKISRSVAEIKLGRRQYFELGNLNSRRDWGHARDYVEAMWLMLQQDEPNDFVIASGQSHSVREFVELAFQVIGCSIKWSGAGLCETGHDCNSGATRVKVNGKFFRPAEVDHLLGDASFAKQKLGWQVKTSFSELVSEMVLADIELLSREPNA